MQTAIFVFNLLYESGAVISIKELNAKCEKQGLRTGDFVWSFCGMMQTKGHLLKFGSDIKPAFKFDKDYELGVKYIHEVYEVKDENPPASVEYYNQAYGFNKLVAKVSKWIDHENNVQREYDIDRLWLGRYIDFLDKAKEYFFWMTADQAIAAKKMEALKKGAEKIKSKNKH